jgi:hypothetical protein
MLQNFRMPNARAIQAPVATPSTALSLPINRSVSVPGRTVDSVDAF